jgi:FHS family Na+ dependent glucose MFS transporter 1
VGGNTLLIWTHGEKVGPFMGGLQFFYGVGAFFAPLIITRAVLLSGDILWAYWALAALIPFVAFVLIGLPSPKAQKESQMEGEKPADFRLVLLMVLFFFLYVGAEVGYGGWIFTYATASHLGDGLTAGYLNAAFWGAFTLGRLFTIPLAAWLKPQSILYGSLAGCLVCLGLILCFPTSLPIIWIGSLGVGFAIAPLFPTAMTLAGSRMTVTGKITGWFLMGAGAGGMFLPWLIGQWFEGIGPWITMAAIVVDLAATVGVVALFNLWSEEPVLPELA